VADWNSLIRLGALALVVAVAAIGVLHVVSKRAAAERGRLVVRDVLTRVEVGMLLEHGYLDVPSRVTPERIYRIPAQPGMVTVIDAGRPTMRLCLVPARAVPEQEQVVIHKLMLEAAEADYWKGANRFPGGLAPWPDAPRVAVWTAPPPGVIGQR
jgi:hypothetical protein